MGSFEGPAEEALQQIVIDSKDGVTGRFVIIRQKRGIITFAEVRINKGTNEKYLILSYLISRDLTNRTLQDCGSPLIPCMLMKT